MKNQIFVKDWMSSPVYTVEPTTSIADAYSLLMQKGIRRLPVEVDGRLVGIVTLGDLREARPAPASSLSIYELNYLLAKLDVSQVMTYDPYTVTSNTPIQDAARIMLEQKVGGLPVVDGDDKLIGIVTETDIFRMLIDRWDYFTAQHIDPGPAINLNAEQANK